MLREELETYLKQGNYPVDIEFVKEDEFKVRFKTVNIHGARVTISFIDVLTVTLKGGYYSLKTHTDSYVYVNTLGMYSVITRTIPVAGCIAAIDHYLQNKGLSRLR